VTAKQDKIIEALIAKETTRLDGLKDCQTKLDDQIRGNVLLTREEALFAQVTIKHNYEATHPPPFRSPDPNSNETFVLPEHYELISPGRAPLHILLLDADKVLEFYGWVARVYGTIDLLWTVNFWRAVETLRSLTTTGDAFTYSKRLKRRMLQIVDRYLSPRSVNPVRVANNTATKAINAAVNLRRMSFLTTGLPRLARYGALLHALYQGQYEAFVSLSDNLSKPYWASDVGKQYLYDIQSKRWEKWKKDEEEVVAKHKEDLLNFAREMKKDIERKARLKQLAINNQADTAVKQLIDQVAEYLVIDACGNFAIWYNDMLDDILVDSLDGAERIMLEELVAKSVAVVAEERYIDELATMVVDEVVLPIFTDTLILEAGMIAYQQIEAAIEDKSEVVLDALLESVAEYMVVEGMRETLKANAIVRIQCWCRRFMAVRKARRQLAYVLVKQWEPTYQCYYYVNTLTGESSWDRPRIIDRLFPHRAITQGLPDTEEKEETADQSMALVVTQDDAKQKGASQNASAF